MEEGRKEKKEGRRSEGSGKEILGERGEERRKGEMRTDGKE